MTPADQGRPIAAATADIIGKDLTAEEQFDVARDHLGWARQLVHRKCGPKGLDFVEIALAEAITTHDGRSPLKAWAFQKIPWVVKRELNKLYDSDVVSITDDLMAAGVDALTTSDTPTEGFDAGRVIEGLRIVDDRAGLERWQSLAAALGQFTHQQTRRMIRQAWLPDFQTPDEAADAAMLFGGSLWQTRPGYGRPAIEFGRKLGNTQAMAWMMLMLERHDPQLCRFSLASSVESIEKYQRVIYRVRPHRYFASAYARWYAGGCEGRRTPLDCVTDATLTCWLVGGLYTAKPYEGVNLHAQGLTVPRATEIVAQVRQRGIGCTIKTKKLDGSLVRAYIAIDPLHRAAAEQWLDERVPRFVWEWR